MEKHLQDIYIRAWADRLGLDATGTTEQILNEAEFAINELREELGYRDQTPASCGHRPSDCRC